MAMFYLNEGQEARWQFTAKTIRNASDQLSATCNTVAFH